MRVLFRLFSPYGILLFVLCVLPIGFVYSAESGAVESDENTTSETADKAALRSLLIEILTENSASANDETTTSMSPRPVSERMAFYANQLKSQLVLIQNALPQLPEAMLDIYRSVTYGGSWIGLGYTLGSILFMWCSGLLAEWLLFRCHSTSRYTAATPHAKPTQRQAVTQYVVHHLTRLTVFALVSFVVILFITDEDHPVQLLLIYLHATVVIFRFWLILLRLLFGTKQLTLQPLFKTAPNNNPLATLALFLLLLEVSNHSLLLFTDLGLSELLVSALLVPMAFALNIYVITFIWLQRQHITHIFTYDTSPRATSSPPIWPIVLTLWLTLVLVLWLYKMLMGLPDDADDIGLAWWLTLLFPVLDRLILTGLRAFIKQFRYSSKRYIIRSRRFIRIVQSNLRLLLLAVAFYSISDAWGPGTQAMLKGEFIQRGLGHFIELLLFVLLGYIIWELTHLLIEKRLPEEPEGDAVASLEGEGGADGGSRAETLLPLLRSVLTAIFTILFVLAVLSSMGVQIMPLLAGAGIVGIAIGFGAQRLVQDILSGIFFLVDDAFRKGEYVQIETLRGTVEKISLRSMQLRHHLGPVQTIPYGTIQTITNMSRDWITMKLELRLPYDTDIEKVRKIIKKVGISMMEDDAFKESFLLPLKSQGVNRVEESALIVRMKFTTKPGHQWIVRREAYRKVKEALSEQGIEFAHREVRVRLPESLEKQLPEQPEDVRQELASATAAAGDAIAAEMAARQKQTASPADKP